MVDLAHYLDGRVNSCSKIKEWEERVFDHELNVAFEGAKWWKKDRGKSESGIGVHQSNVFMKAQL